MLRHLSNPLSIPFGIVVDRLSNVPISSVSAEFVQDIYLVFLGLLVCVIGLPENRALYTRKGSRSRYVLAYDANGHGFGNRQGLFFR
jgi:hypothetical protein